MISATSASSSNGLPADNSTGASGSANNRPMSNSAGDNVLDFSMAMSNFKSMFPNLDVCQIEQVLRKHDGDVTNTINELLGISESGDTTSSSSSSGLSSSHCQKADDVKPDATTNQKKCSSASTYSRSSSSTSAVAAMSSSALSAAGGEPQQQRPNCAEDEKIALLMQNREFLNYLQRDTRFMREIYGNYGHKQYDQRRLHPTTVAYGGTLPGYSALPPSQLRQPAYYMGGDGRWRKSSHLRDEYFTYDPYNYGSRGADTSGYENISFVGGGGSRRRRSNSSSGRGVELVKRVPDGPIVDFSKGSIPNGPLIDFGDAGGAHSSKKWADRVKSHLPLSIGGKSSPCSSSSSSSSKAVIAASHYSAQHRRDTDGDDSSYIEYTEFSNEPFADRLKNMSRNSKTLFLSLAKKFSLSKKSPNEAHWPTEIGRQASEELDSGPSATMQHYSNDSNYSLRGGSETTKKNR